jgi:hypothetical protein
MMFALAPTPYLDAPRAPELHICPGTVKAFRVRSSDGEVFGHFDTREDAGHAIRSVTADLAKLRGVEACS